MLGTLVIWQEITHDLQNINIYVTLFYPCHHHISSFHFQVNAVHHFIQTPTNLHLLKLMKGTCFSTTKKPSIRGLSSLLGLTSQRLSPKNIHDLLFRDDCTFQLPGPQRKLLRFQFPSAFHFNSIFRCPESCNASSYACSRT